MWWWCDTWLIYVIDVIFQPKQPSCSTLMKYHISPQKHGGKRLMEAFLQPAEGETIPEQTDDGYGLSWSHFTYMAKGNPLLSSSSGKPGGKGKIKINGWVVIACHLTPGLALSRERNSILFKRRSESSNKRIIATRTHAWTQIRLWWSQQLGRQNKKGLKTSSKGCVWWFSMKKGALSSSIPMPFN